MTWACVWLETALRNRGGLNAIKHLKSCQQAIVGLFSSSTQRLE